MRNILIFGLIFLVIAVVVGQVLATSVIEVQKNACGVFEQSLTQLNSDNTATSNAETEAKCLKLVESTKIFTRLIAFAYAVVGTVVLCGIIFVLLSLSYGFSSPRRR